MENGEFILNLIISGDIYKIIFTKEFFKELIKNPKKYWKIMKINIVITIILWLKKIILIIIQIQTIQIKH